METTVQDRRLIQRHPRDGALIPVTIAADGSADVVFLHDLSVAGMGLLSERRHPPGTQLQIKIPNAEAGAASVITATVRHVTEHEDGHWLHGCALSALLTVDDIVGIG